MDKISLTIVTLYLLMAWAWFARESFRVVPLEQMQTTEIQSALSLSFNLFSLF